MLAFLSLKSESLKSEVGIMRAMAVESNSKMLRVIINTGRDVHKRNIEFLGITNEGPPTFRAFKLGEETAKFKPNQNTTEQGQGNRENNPTKDQLPKIGWSSLGPHISLHAEAVPNLVKLPGAVHIRRRHFLYSTPTCVPQGYNPLLVTDWLRPGRDPC